MAFNFNWAPTKIPTQLMGPDVNEEMAHQATMQDAAQSMAGYKPSIDISSQMAMQGYAPADNSMKGGNAQPNLEGYGESLQAASDAAAQAQAIEQQKAELQSQIAALETRIKENTAKLQKWSGNANQIAAIEARKINSQDPTMIWRWKMGQDAAKQQRADDLKRIEAEKTKAKAEQKQAFINKLNATLPTMSVNLNTSPEQAQMYKNTLAGLEADAATYNVSDPRITEIKNALYGDLPYNAMMAAIDELEDINANYGKGSEYDKMTEAQKFNVFRNKLETARQNLINTNPALWEMMERDSRYRNKFNNLLSSRKPKSKGKDPVRAAK